ncbi:MAG: beta strand repeat-containing protein, partial [bacterium]
MAFPTVAVPAAISWDAAGSGNWETAVNWSGDIVPGAADDATISIAGINTITYSGSAGTRTVQSLALTGGNALSVTGGALTVTAAFSSAGTTSISSGTLTLSGTSALGGLTLTGGVLDGAGTTVLNGAMTMGNFTSVSLDEGRTLRIAGGATLQNNTIQLNANNTGNPTAGLLVNALGSTITDNSSSGSNIVSNDFTGTVNGDNGRSALFTNLGTYTKTGAGSSTISVAMANSGTININQGSLTLGGSSSGSITTHAGATITGAGLLILTSGTHTFDAASTISTANVTVNGGTTTINGAYNVSGTSTFTSGTVSMPAVIASIGSTLVVNGGNADFGANNLTVNALTLSSGSIRGTGNLTVSAGGTVAFSGGQMLGAGTTILNPALTMGNFTSIGLDEGRTLRIAGGATLQNNTIQLNATNTGNPTAGRLENAVGSTITDNSSSGSNIASTDFTGTVNGDNGRSALFTNLGTYTKTGAGSSTISVAMANSGTINLNPGSLTRGGSSSGSITTHTGA